MVPGGLSETKPATPEVQHIADQVKAEFERKEDRTFDIFQAIEYRTQVVAGTNYFIKVVSNEEKRLIVRVFQALPQEKQGPSLVSYQTGKTRDDPLDYF
uniref:Cystatin domain-containing protein n=1 Tax=Anas platyrhynchos TaxID=8839 RepID=A0A8B9ST95_ANAPL